MPRYIIATTPSSNAYGASYQPMAFSATIHYPMVVPSDRRIAVVAEPFMRFAAYMKSTITMDRQPDIMMDKGTTFIKLVVGDLELATILDLTAGPFNLHDIFSYVRDAGNEYRSE